VDAETTADLSLGEKRHLNEMLHQILKRVTDAAVEPTDRPDGG
jgi:hypothetical protein